MAQLAQDITQNNILIQWNVLATVIKSLYLYATKQVMTKKRRENAALINCVLYIFSVIIVLQNRSIWSKYSIGMGRIMAGVLGKDKLFEKLSVFVSKECYDTTLRTCCIGGWLGCVPLDGSDRTRMDHLQ